MTPTNSKVRQRRFGFHIARGCSDAGRKVRVRPRLHGMRGFQLRVRANRRLRLSRFKFDRCEGPSRGAKRGGRARSERHRSHRRRNASGLSALIRFDEGAIDERHNDL